MGLDIVVGAYCDIDKEGLEATERLDLDMSAVAGAMIQAGLPAHAEPKGCALWSASGYGYSGLHALREVAGLVWLGKPIPRDAVIDGSTTLHEEELLQAIWPQIGLDQPAGLIQQLLGKFANAKELPPFAHLMAHSDAQGFYVPTDFRAPLIPQPIPKGTHAIWPLGSVPRLSAELATLLKVLEAPDSLSYDDDILIEILDDNSAISTGPLWQAQPIASYTALVLQKACMMSLATGAAIIFT